MSYKIMIVEDDISISKLLSNHIEKYGYEAITTDDFNNVLHTFTSLNPHVVLLDVNLPKFDGYYWCRQIRNISTCPIIFISARSGELEQIMAIESGADDYITKPFYYDVVIAKIKGHLRRSYGAYSSPATERTLSLQGLTLYPERPEVKFKDKIISLTKKEAILLETLINIYPKTASREVLLEKLWDDQSFVEENTLNVNVARVRKKLEDVGIKDSIETVRGMGYKLSVTWEK